MQKQPLPNSDLKLVQDVNSESGEYVKAGGSEELVKRRLLNLSVSMFRGRHTNSTDLCGCDGSRFQLSLDLIGVDGKSFRYPCLRF